MEETNNAPTEQHSPSVSASAAPEPSTPTPNQILNDQSRKRSRDHSPDDTQFAEAAGSSEVPESNEIGNPEGASLNELNDSTIIIDGVLQPFPARGRFSLPRLQHRQIMNDKDIIQPVQRFSYIELKPKQVYRTKVYTPPNEKDLCVDFNMLEKIMRSAAKMASTFGQPLLNGPSLSDTRFDDETERSDIEESRRHSQSSVQDDPSDADVSLDNPGMIYSQESISQYDSDPRLSLNDASLNVIPTLPMNMEEEYIKEDYETRHLPAASLCRPLPIRPAVILKESSESKSKLSIKIDRSALSTNSDSQQTSSSPRNHQKKASKDGPVDESQILKEYGLEDSDSGGQAQNPWKMVRVKSTKKINMGSSLFDFLFIRSSEERLRDIPPGWRHRLVENKIHHSSRTRSDQYRFALCAICLKSDLPLVPCNSECKRLFHPHCVGIDQKDFVIPTKVLKNNNRNVRKSANILRDKHASSSSSTIASDSTSNKIKSTEDFDPRSSNDSDGFSSNHDDSMSDDSSDYSSSSSDSESSEEKPKHHIRGWVCEDCVVHKHMCGFCGVYGEDGVDVFKCFETGCGVFFHEACVKKAPLVARFPPSDTTTQELASTSAVSTPAQKTISFRCPCHICHKCLLPGERSAFLSCATCTSSFHFSCLSGKYQMVSTDTIFCGYCLENQEKVTCDSIVKEGKPLQSLTQEPAKRIDPNPSLQYILSSVIFRQVLCNQNTPLCQVYIYLKEKPVAPPNIIELMSLQLDISSTADFGLLAQLSLIEIAILEFRPFSEEDIAPFTAIKNLLATKNKVIFAPTKTGYLITLQTKSFKKLPTTLPLYRHNHVLHGKIFKRR